jgi:mannose-1-phosphate guanylyltransferase/phosphomannomutase
VKKTCSWFAGKNREHLDFDQPRQRLEPIAMKGIVLSADPCGDLSILKNEIPKAMVRIGQRPVMDWMLKLLKMHEITEIMATLHCYPEEVQDYFGDGSRSGLQIWYSQEPKMIGNAGSMKRLESFFGKQAFVALAGGILTDIDIKGIIDLHRSKHAAATIGLVKQEYFGKQKVYLGDDGVTVLKPQKESKPTEKARGYRSCGVYVLEPRVLEYIPEERLFDFEKDLLPKLLENKEKICGFVHDGYWLDIDTLANFKKANFDLLRKKINLKIQSGDVSVGDGVRIGRGTEIHKSVQIYPPISIGSECLIREDVRLIGPAVIGDKTIIDRDVSFRGSIVWGRGYVGKDSCINGALIGDSTYISSNVEIRKKTILGLNCIVGPNSSIHEGAILSPATVVKKNSTIDFAAGNKLWSASS